MGNVQLVERKYQALEVTEKNEAIMHRWIAKLSDGGNTPSIENTKVALQAMAEWDNPTVKGRPSLITPYPGFGKSFLLEFYLWEKLRDRDTTTGLKNIRTDFGAIIVKSEREQVKALVDAINKSEKMPGHPQLTRIDKQPYAYGLYGYDPDAPDGMTPNYTAYKRQETDQEKYNIIVMTAQKLKQLTLQGALDDYRSFVNEAGERCDRSLLIIDEKPAVLENHKVTEDDLHRVIKWALARAHKKAEYQHLSTYLKRLRDALEDSEVLNKQILEPDADSKLFAIDHRIAYMLGNENQYEMLTKLRAMQHILNHGGMVTKYEDDKGALVCYISCAMKVHYDWTHLNASILDGTGHLAKEYVLINAELTHIRPVIPPQYENLHYYISEEHNLSRNTLKPFKDSEVIARMKRYCETIQRRHPDTKFLVITYKKYEEKLSKELDDNILLMTKYFDGGRASNEYIDCNGVIFLGNGFKTEDFYINMASVINGKVIDDKRLPSKTGATFTDKDVETFRLTNTLEDFMQELSRTRPVQKDVTIPVYMFHKDQTFIDRIKDECPGAKFSKYSASFKITGKAFTKHQIIELIESMKPGDKVKKSEWYKSKGITTKTFSKAMKTQEVIDAMTFNNVRVKGHYLVKDETQEG